MVTLVNIEYNASFTLEIKECRVDYLMAAFKQLLPLLLGVFVEVALKRFAEKAMLEEQKPFACECGNGQDFIWKTKNAKPTVITTIFGILSLPQIQVQCKACGKKMFITRKLLGIEPRGKMSEITGKTLALVGALTTFRVSEKIFAMFGAPFVRVTVWRCVQKVGKTIGFALDPKELPSGQADGTGIPIVGIKKRGMELKVFIQNKVAGGARIAGLAIGKYESGWDKLFGPSLEAIRSFKRFLLLTDGDTSILSGIKGVEVLLQRCLWHIPHQLKHCLWADKVKKDSALWRKIMGKIFNISGIRGQMTEDEIVATLAEKRAAMDKLIALCVKHDRGVSATYLANAKADMFTALENRLNGKTTSLVERVMKTVNMRVNVGKWTPAGAMNAMNVRLAHYYNGWSPMEPDAKEVKITRL